MFRSKAIFMATIKFIFCSVHIVKTLIALQLLNLFLRRFFTIVFVLIFWSLQQQSKKVLVICKKKILKSVKFDSGYILFCAFVTCATRSYKRLDIRQLRIGYNVLKLKLCRKLRISKHINKYFSFIMSTSGNIFYAFSIKPYLLSTNMPQRNVMYHTIYSFVSSAKNILII